MDEVFPRELLEIGTKQYGVRSDLQAFVRHEPNACGGWVLDLTLGCSHGCVYCLFSPLEKRMFQLMVPDYRGQVLAFKLDELLAQEKLPPVVYMSYSSDPLQPVAVRSTVVALRRLVERGVKVFLVTKGRMPAEVLRIIEASPSSFAVQVGLTSADEERNRLIEPGVPPYADRLRALGALAAVQGLHSLAARIDPIFPGIDDAEAGLVRVLDDLGAAGVRKIIVSYLIVTEALRDELARHEELRPSLACLTAPTTTISKRRLLSLPHEEKVQRLRRIQALAGERGIAMHTCGCKDEQLKNVAGISWICHPFRTLPGEKVSRLAEEQAS